MDKKKQRNPVAKELVLNAKFKHKMEKSYKERLHEQEEEEFDQELKDYIDGKESL